MFVQNFAYFVLNDEFSMIVYVCVNIDVDFFLLNHKWIFFLLRIFHDCVFFHKHVFVIEIYFDEFQIIRWMNHAIQKLILHYFCSNWFEIRDRYDVHVDRNQDVYSQNTNFQNDVSFLNWLKYIKIFDQKFVFCENILILIFVENNRVFDVHIRLTFFRRFQDFCLDWQEKKNFNKIFDLSCFHEFFFNDRNLNFVNVLNKNNIKSVVEFSFRRDVVWSHDVNIYQNEAWKIFHYVKFFDNRDKEFIRCCDFYWKFNTFVWFLFFVYFFATNLLIIFHDEYWNIWVMLLNCDFRNERRFEICIVTKEYFCLIR